MKKIRVLIADDHEIVRMGLASLLGTKKDVEVVGEAEDGEAAVRKAVKLAPDVVIMDLMMPKKDGVAATVEIRRRLPSAKIMILTSYGTSDGIAHALSAGASGALMKSTEFSEFVAAIRTIAAGGQVVAPEIKRQFAKDPPVPDLTQRQHDILNCHRHAQAPSKDIDPICGAQAASATQTASSRSPRGRDAC